MTERRRADPELGARTAKAAMPRDRDKVAEIREVGTADLHCGHLRVLSPKINCVEMRSFNLRPNGQTDSNICGNVRPLGAIGRVATIATTTGQAACERMAASEERSIYLEGPGMGKSG